jgi:hypothetical protein
MFHHSTVGHEASQLNPLAFVFLALKVTFTARTNAVPHNRRLQTPQPDAEKPNKYRESNHVTYWGAVF